MVRDALRATDAMLDEMARLYTERDNALDELGAFVREHPEFEMDDHLVVARLALLPEAR